MDTTLLAQTSSSLHQPSCAHDNFLGKRHTILNHHTLHSATNHADDCTSLFKRQKVATYVNTRHMALYFPHSSCQQDILAPVEVSEA